jgi:hypothetical protein
MRTAEETCRPALFSRSVFSRPLRLVAIALVALLLQGSLGGCFGRWALTRKVYALNQSVNDKWLRSILAFVLVVVPVYGVTALADWALLNTIEFWGGSNPVDGQSSDKAPPPVAPPSLTLSDDGTQLRVVAMRGPAPGAVPRVLVLTMREGGAELRDGDGALIATLLREDNGDARVVDRAGDALGTKSAEAQGALLSALQLGGRALIAELELQSGARLAKR